ncbi:helix-turn-helix domain-containing protein [Pontibacter silvestris]|uniref:Helix-turn-helix domain-containing protein n=1 Tax=Pontibacter silvestris TaxID=2305183 RepID=A0ABW4X1G2_9BACT|nr:helix-turn-helix domain-containing protein [Pontibacter silvestris]MCC9135437.1 AraC family transcriptional regulator [Pontibacter silvestris]
MPRKDLPVYQIQNFQPQAYAKANFYIKYFEEHLLEHAFIQKPHKHDFYIVLLVTYGTGTHTIDFKTYPVKPGTVFFLSPGQVHSWQLSVDAKGTIIFFSTDFYLLEQPQKKLRIYPFFNNMLHKPLVQLSEHEVIFLQSIFQQMEQEYIGQRWKKEDIIRNYLDIIFILLTRVYQSQNPDEQNKAKILSELEQFEDLLEQHYKQHLPVSFYAEQLHVTVKQLNDTCKRAFGKTATECIQDRLVLEASRLLIHSENSVTQIAAELGFFDNSYFARFFRKHTGFTPKQFRESH